MQLDRLAFLAALYAPPDGGGASPGTGGDSPSPSAETSVPDSDASGGGEADHSATSQEPIDDVDAALVDNDQDHADLPSHILNHPRVKAIRNRLRAAQRTAARVKLAESRLQELGDIDRLRFDAQQYRQLAPLLEQNPHFRGLVFGEQQQPREQRQPADEPFDEENYPYERDSPQGQYLYRLAKEHHEQRQMVRMLSRDLGRIHQTREQEGLKAERSQWSGVAMAAAGKLPANQRQMFLDAVHGAYMHAKRKGINTTPQRVVEYYLKGQNLTPAVQAAAQTAAAKQAMAQRNQQQPRGAAFAGQGQPAPAQKKRFTVTDLGRVLRQKYG